MKIKSTSSKTATNRRGSTLVIVIALLGLLMFTGMVFYTFAMQEQTSAKFFAEAAKSSVNEPNDVWSHMLEQLIVGPSNQYKGSKIFSPMRRHSLIGTGFGTDIIPFSGTPVPVGYTPVDDTINSVTVQIPNSITLAGPFGGTGLNVVDSPVAYGFLSPTANANDRLTALQDLAQQRSPGGGLPEPDVDFTAPDLSNMFLAKRGYALAALPDGAGGTQKQLVPYIIPSWVRPQYMKSVQSQFSAGAIRTIDTNAQYVPTDPHWLYSHIDSTDPNVAATVQEPTESNGAGVDNRSSVPYQQRHFRPHPLDIAGILPDGTITLRYLTDGEASTLGVSAGGFPILPENLSTSTAEDASIRGEMGVWTGSNPLVYELDFDNDGDGIREGVLLDLRFPVQEVTDSSGNVRQYVVMHSMTVYDQDSLLNLNVHGNLAGIPKTFDTTDALGNDVTEEHTLLTLQSEGELESQFVSKSNLGLGPNEVNPLHALRRSLAALDIQMDEEDAILAFHLNRHFGAVPGSDLELANMLWIWLMMGRGNFEVDVITDPATGEITVSEKALDDIFQGRFGDEYLLFTSLMNRTPALQVTELPRPGRAGDVFNTVSTGVSFGGRNGFDDNGNSREGEAFFGSALPYGHPLDFAGTGLHYLSEAPVFDPAADRWTLSGIGGGNPDPRRPLMLHDFSSFGPERWRGYQGYSVSSNQNTTDKNRYFFGPDGIYNGGNAELSGDAADTSDDLVHNPTLDPLFEDMLESIFEPDLAKRPEDDIFSVDDMLALLLSSGDFDTAEMSSRLTQLAPHVFGRNQTWKDNTPPLSATPLERTPDNRQMFTTLSNDFRFLKVAQPFGSDSKPGQANFDDDNDGTVDEADEVLAGGFTDVDNLSRWWEFSADADGFDANGDGYADGDGNLEFPPRFWNDKDGDGVVDTVDDPSTPENEIETIQTYSALDPFRPQLRRLLTVEAGETRDLIGALPMSINHILDINRAGNRPAEGSVEFLTLLQQAGMTFRGLTPHPHLSEDDVVDNTDVLSNSLASAVEFPPTTVAQREYWARLDRQRMARDIFVLLYTVGGARTNGVGIKDYTGTNDPILEENDTSSNALYTHEQLRRMAQFAVNVVDALDNDEVVTKFEYDKNLGNGWNLDDNPWTDDGFSPARDQRELDPSDPDYAEAFPEVVGTPARTSRRYRRITGNGRFREDSGEIDTADADMDGSTTDVINQDRGVVYGTEGAQLAFSEVLAIESPQLSMDHPSTQFDDSTEVRRFIFAELQNLSPKELDLATSESTTAETAIWRLVRMDRTVDDTAGAEDRIDTIRHPNRVTKALAILDDGANAVDGGGRFSIAATSDRSLSSSSFYMDTGDVLTGNFDGDFELIAPDAPGVSSLTGTDPLVDMDNLHSNHSGRFAQVGGTDFLDAMRPAYAGNEVYNGINSRFNDSSRAGFDLVLQRRMNPNQPLLDTVENPWVEVDRIRATFASTQLQDTDGPSDIFSPGVAAPTGRLVDNVFSIERREPLGDSTQVNGAAKTDSPYRRNTVKGGIAAGVPLQIADSLGINSSKLPDPLVPASATNEAIPFALWQPHFDREFTSMAELLNVTLLPPSEVTHRLAHTRLSPLQQSVVNSSAILPTLDMLDIDPQQDLLSGSAAMFLMPDFPTDSDALYDHDQDGTADLAVNESARDNRWHRLFQFAEVPSRVHRQLGNYLNIVRAPGKLNLNMLRHLEVYAGLLDDPALAQVDTNNSQAEMLRDSTPGGFRDRWEEFLRERDGIATTTLIDPTPDDDTLIDPNAASDGLQYSLYLPGLPSSKPFRAIGNDTANSQSILREMAFDHDDDLDGIEDNVDLVNNTTGAAGADGIPDDESDEDPRTNRHWLEIGSKAFHRRSNTIPSGVETATSVQQHQLLSKIMNNTTTVSNTFAVYSTAAYYEAYTDPTTGFVRVGGRIDLDNPGDNGNNTEDAGEDHSTGWEQRAVFVIDRTDALNAFDKGTGTFDWQRLVKLRADID